MTSNWALPNTVEQYAETDAELIHVSWDSSDNFQKIKNKNGKFLKTSRDLIHIARDPRTDITEKTYFLRCTNFNFINIPNVISGIELKLTSNRFGRITDDLIQLTLNDTLIGSNLADLTLDPVKVYGNKTFNWNTNLQKENVMLTTFGVVLRFKSHPYWPHKSNMFIDSIELRIY